MGRSTSKESGASGDFVQTELNFEFSANPKRAEIFDFFQFKKDQKNVPSQKQHLNRLLRQANEVHWD